VTLKTSLLRVLNNACTSTPEYQKHTKFKVPSFTNSKDMIGAKYKDGSRDPDHTH